MSFPHYTQNYDWPYTNNLQSVEPIPEPSQPIAMSHQFSDSSYYTSGGSWQSNLGMDEPWEDSTQDQSYITDQQDGYTRSPTGYYTQSSSYQDAYQSGYQPQEGAEETIFDERELDVYIKDEPDDRPTSEFGRRRSSGGEKNDRWPCLVENCESCFTRSADLQRHYNTVHNMVTVRLPCPKPKCGRVGSNGFTRKDHLTEHLRSYHKEVIPKRGRSGRETK